jgi:hypothetical protein
MTDPERREELGREIDKLAERAAHAVCQWMLTLYDEEEEEEVATMDIVKAAESIAAVFKPALLPIIERAVGGAYAAAADIVPDGPLTYTYREAILRLTPADATTAIERAVQAEREACCKLQCPICRLTHDAPQLIDGLWKHYDGTQTCQASAIRARSQDQRSPEGK